MFIYLFVFFLSILLLSAEEKIAVNNTSISKGLNANRIFCLLLLLLAILPPSLLAGFRDYSIGTDVSVYGNIWFNIAVKTPSFLNYINWATSSSIGFLYALFNYVVARFTNNPHFFYFWYSFIEIAIVVFTLKKNRDLVSLPIGMAIFLFLFFNLSLNILRQGMSLVILLYGFSYIRQKNLIKYTICLLIAYLFHNTALIGILVYLIYNYSNKKPRIVYQLIIVLVTLVIICGFTQIQSYLLNVNILDQRYSTYLNNSNLVRGGFLTHLFLFCFPTLMLYFFNKSENNTFYGLRMIVIVSALLSILNLKIAFLSRITLYFDIFFVFALGYIVDKGKNINYKSLSFNKIILFIYLLTYWIIIYALMGSGETVPYIFMTY